MGSPAHRRDLEALWVIEGIGSYGALLAGTVARAGYRVVEAPRVTAYAPARRGSGKSDPLDAAAIAAAALPLEEEQLRIPRQDEGVRTALRVLVAAREQMTVERTAKVNALTALLRSVDLGIDARRPLTDPQVIEVSHWRIWDESLSAATARKEAVRLAKRITRPRRRAQGQPRWSTRRGRIWAGCAPRQPSPPSPA